MIDDAELDRAIMHQPAAILALDKAHRLADQRLTEIDLRAAPADRAVAMDPPHRRVSRVFGLTQDAVPAPWRQPVVLCRSGVAERGPTVIDVTTSLEVTFADITSQLAKDASPRRR